MSSDDTLMLPPTEPNVPYAAIRPELATGDLFFLQTASPQAKWIKRLEDHYRLPPYSHLGMVVKDGNKLLLWDAPGRGECFPDPYAAEDPDNRLYGSPPEHPGCRVSELDAVLAYYATKVDVKPTGFWLRRLAHPVSGEQFAALRRFINRADGMPFPEELGYAALAANFAAGQAGMTMFFGTYFCSQLVADSYMHMGMLEMEGRPPNAYAPAHFGIETANFGITDAPPWVPPAGLGGTMFVTWS
jgi:hypothetical protein